MAVTGRGSRPPAQLFSYLRTIGHRLVPGGQAGELTPDGKRRERRRSPEGRAILFRPIVDLSRRASRAVCPHQKCRPSSNKSSRYSRPPVQARPPSRSFAHARSTPATAAAAASNPPFKLFSGANDRNFSSRVLTSPPPRGARQH